MGATGSSKSGSSNSIMSYQDGGTNVKFESPLVYSDKKQTLPDKSNTQIISFENKHTGSKREHSIFLMDDGSIVETNTGGKTSVSASLGARQKADIMSHNHPNPVEGALGGTFSGADLNNFINFGQHMYRASAKEGTYVISMNTSDPSYTRTNALNLLNQYQSLEKQQNRQYKKLQKQWMSETSQEISNIYSNKKLSSAEKSKKINEANNKFMEKQRDLANKNLIEAHNWLIKNANSHGFTYGLERRG